MNKTRHIFAFTLLTLLLAACSEDNGLNPSAPEDNTVPVAFTVVMDNTIQEYGTAQEAKNIATRSAVTGSEQPTRCCAQAFENTIPASGVEPGTLGADGKYSFTFHLDPEKTYTYLFWADNASEPIYRLDDASYSPGTTVVALAGKKSGTPTTVNNQEITLTHVVTKITLRTGADMTVPASGGSVAITTNSGTRFNVSTGSAISSGSQMLTATISQGRTFKAGDDVASFYIIPTGATQTVTVTDFGRGTHTIEAVPTAADTHVVLQGDLGGN